ncbi:pilus assembly protein [Zobellella iuensis]|uniref:Pilus assembly protein n=1 Tax=Zobellella iuensis TaxID=2803811 RepID=A0ABS1QQS9_9GAMM|nr:pilus assembly protein [Zobellella iuensis]
MEQTFLVYSSNQEDVEWLQSTLLPYQVLAVNERLDEILGLIDITEASLIFVGLDSDSMTSQCGLIEGLLEARPLLTVVGLGDGLDNQLVINAMRAGARDFIVYGMRSSEVLGLVRRLTQRVPVLPVQKSGNCQTLLYGVQPDPDAALVSAHMAQQLQQKGKRVLLLDLGRPTGESLEVLGVKPSFTFGDALRNLRRLDGNLIDSAFCHHGSGLSVLALGEEDPTFNQVPSTELYLLKGALSQHFDHVVINLVGQSDCEQLRTLVNHCQQLYWYVDQSVSCCKRNLHVLNRWRESGIRLEHAGLVVDRYIKQVAPDADTLATTFQLPLLASLPASLPARLKVKNTGKTLLEMDAREPLNKAIGQLARHIVKTSGTGESRNWLQRLVGAVS